MNHSGDLRAAKRLIECGGEQPRFRVGLQRSFDVRQNVDCFAVEDRFVLVGPFGVRRKMVVRERVLKSSTALKVSRLCSEKRGSLVKAAASSQS